MTVRLPFTLTPLNGEPFEVWLHAYAARLNMRVGQLADPFGLSAPPHALDVHPRVAMQILRHSRIGVTMEIYTEATSEATRYALRRLGDSLGSDDDG